MSRIPIALSTLLLIGCGVNEDTFAYKFSVVSCKKSYQCDQEDFLDVFDDVAECVDETEPFMEEVQDWSEALCDIDYQLASQCYRELKWASCDDWNDSGWYPEVCEDYLICDGFDSGWW